jgi:arylsulfatase
LHAFTHTKPESLGHAGLWQSGYHDTMIDHDKNAGTVLGDQAVEKLHKFLAKD